MDRKCQVGDIIRSRKFVSGSASCSRPPTDPHAFILVGELTLMDFVCNDPGRATYAYVVTAVEEAEKSAGLDSDRQHRKYLVAARKLNEHGLADSSVPEIRFNQDPEGPVGWGYIEPASIEHLGWSSDTGV